VHQYQRVDAAFGDEPGANHRLAKGGRCGQHAEVVCDDGLRCLELGRSQLAVKRKRYRRARLSSIADLNPDPVALEQLENRRASPTPFRGISRLRIRCRFGGLVVTASVEAGPAIGRSRVACIDASAGCEQGCPGSFVERIHPSQARDSIKPRVRTDDCGYAIAEAGGCMYAIVGAEVWGAE
jgi:hypothetical protein